MACDTSIFAHEAVIVPDFITPAEEARILLRIGQAPWLTELRRRVQHYGFQIQTTGAAARECLRRPSPAGPRRWQNRLRPHFGGALPVQCIVNEYRPGQGIGMHADHRDFGPAVASLSLGADWPMHFRLRSTRPYASGAMPGDEVATLPRRSVLVLTRAIADIAWMHGIDRADSARETATRVSATFRTLAG